MPSQCRDVLNQNFLQSYLLQGLNMGLGNYLQGETTYTNSFDCRIAEEGFYFIPRMPCSYIIDDTLYNRIFLIASVALYPHYTLLKQPTMYLVELDTEDVHTQRALFFPWIKGISKRLMIADLGRHVKKLTNSAIIPIMSHLSLNYDKTCHIGLAGTSGGGKSYMLTYLLSCLKSISNLVIIDPKFDSPSRWGRDNGITVISPVENRSKSDFLASVNDVLSDALKLIHRRQRTLYQNPDYQFKHSTIVIDELLALTDGVNKAIKESFFSLLSQIALMGRSTRVHLILVSQRFDHQSMPVSVREQLNVRLQVGHINSSTTQFLFPDLNPEGIVIPNGKGTGLIQVIDDEHPPQIMPLICPTYFIKKGIIV